jgi:hypothetical protein
VRFQDRALLRCTPTPTKAFLLRQWQHLVLSTITLLLTIPTHGTQTDLAEANSQLGRPPSPENAKSNSGTLDLVMSISIENLSQEIAILSSRFSTQLLSCNSSGFGAFDGLVRPRGSPPASLRAHTSQFTLSPRATMITHTEISSLRSYPRFGIALFFLHLFECTTK